MLEVFERKRVAFVSVTQQFNTTNSMGRLMLNVLLSFAQFERELISERTRDKMAASRRKGKWGGGLAPLGYDNDRNGRRIVVNEDEADRVRAIFELYIEFQSIIKTIKELDRRGWKNKLTVTKSGKERGGRYFDKGACSSCSPTSPISARCVTKMRYMRASMRRSYPSSCGRKSRSN